MNPMRILVVGAGVFGVTAADVLARRGHRVTLVDRGPIPHPLAASTDVSKLLRMDYGRDPFYADLMDTCFPAWQDAASWLGAPLYHADGFLALTREPMRPGGFEYESMQVLDRRNHQVTRLDAAAIHALFPAWAKGRFRDAYFNPLAGWVEGNRVVEAWCRRAAEAGVVLRPSAEVRGLFERGGIVRGVRLASGEIVEAERTVVATGAHTPLLLPWLADRIHTTGQPVFHFRPADPALFTAPRFAPWAADISLTGWYGLPANLEGHVKVGHHGTGEPLHADAPQEVTPSMEAAVRHFVAEALPALRDAPIVQRRLCLYTDMFDGHFLIDTAPDHPGLVLATGDAGHAFKFAPRLGEITADVIEGRRNPWRARFAWREAGPRRVEHARASSPPGQGSEGVSSSV